MHRAAAYAQPRGREDGLPDVAAVQLTLEAVHLERFADVGGRLRQHRDAAVAAKSVPAAALQRLFNRRRKRKQEQSYQELMNAQLEVLTVAPKYVSLVFRSLCLTSCYIIL